MLDMSKKVRSDPRLKSGNKSVKPSMKVKMYYFYYHLTKLLKVILQFGLKSSSEVHFTLPCLVKLGRGKTKLVISLITVFSDFMNHLRSLIMYPFSEMK